MPDHIDEAYKAQNAQENSTSGKWLILLAIGTGTFMSALDGSVVNITLPVVRDALNVSMSGIEWVVTVYLLVLSGLLLSFGRLGDLRGHKQVYMTGFFIFVSGSALCGLSQTVEMLIIFRALQALGAAMLSSNSPAILTKTFPASQRGQALGLQATMTYLGLTAGPSLGGWLTGIFGWRSVFYINVPVGLLAIFLSLRFIPQDRGSANGERFDIKGAVLFMGGLIALLLGLNQAPTTGWDSPLIIALLVAAAGILGVFFMLESKTHSPMLDLSLFKKPVFSLSVVSAILNYICIYVITFLMPFYLIQGREFSAAQAGLILTAQPVIMAITAPISGTLSDKYGSRLPGMFGMAVLAGGLFLLSRLNASSPLATIALALAVTGLGTGVFISPNNNALMGAAPRNRQGIAAGILATSRNFGMVLGVGFAGAVFNTAINSSANPAGKEALFSAFSISFLISVIFAVSGVFTTGVRDA